MVDHVVERGDKGNAGQHRMMHGGKHHARAESGNDDARVFDGTVRQHHLHIVFGRGVEDTDQGREAAGD
ncbi:hypothetical protein BMS3Abin13_00967 [bacterium BMS3Abin13]|nr:hypothetical protein BMS3Abin13_00967 [bacterium BMS3Abin13]